MKRVTTSEEKKAINKHFLIGVRGSPERGYFVPACVGSGRWADFESCSRIHACGFRCFEGEFAFWGVICKSRHEPIGVRGFLVFVGRFFKILGRRERTKEEKRM